MPRHEPSSARPPNAILTNRYAQRPSGNWLRSRNERLCPLPAFGVRKDRVMNQQAVALQKQAAMPGAAHRVLQRKCECGAHTPGSSTCRNCQGERGTLQRKLSIGASDDPFEHEADRV